MSLWSPSDSHNHLAAIQSHLTCDSPDLPFEKGANESGDVRPEADSDEVEVLQFAPLFLLDEIGINQSINQSIDQSVGRSINQRGAF